MIVVRVNVETPGEEPTELAVVRISNESGPHDDADYSVQFAVDRFESTALYQRGIHGFPRLKYNVLGLVLQALNTLTEEELSLDRGAAPSNLARRRRGALKKISPW